MTQEQKQTTEHLNEGFRFLEAEYENLLKKHNILLDAADRMAEALNKIIKVDTTIYWSEIDQPSTTEEGDCAAIAREVLAAYRVTKP